MQPNGHFYERSACVPRKAESVHQQTPKGGIKKKELEWPSIIPDLIPDAAAGSRGLTGEKKVGCRGRLHLRPLPPPPLPLQPPPRRSRCLCSRRHHRRRRHRRPPPHRSLIGGMAYAARAVLLLACIAAALHAVAVTANHNLNVQRALSARDERALLAALEDRGRALGALLQSRDVTAALALARGAPRSRELLPPSARALLQDEWASATVSVATLRGLPLPGAATAAPHYVHVTFPGGRRVRVHPASVATAGLPVVGSVPVQGFFYMGEFVADSAGAECGARAGGRVECVVGGEVRAFASAAAAELEVAALWRQAGARSLQMGADPASAPPQPAFDPAYTSGLRRVLLVNVRFAGQSDSDPTLCTMEQVRDGALALEQLHGQRSFGKVTIATTVVSCLIELPRTASWYSLRSDAAFQLHADSLNATQIQTCTPLTSNQMASFQHLVVYHPYLSNSNFVYHGLGSLFGKRVWMNGPRAANSTLCHEIGHNYGLEHASVWPASGSYSEYGDTTDVMGTSRIDMPPYSNGMAMGDYSSGPKIALGWIPSSRYVAFHPHGVSAASGFVRGASFPLAALDRNNAIGVDPFSSYPGSVALAARLTIPPHSTVVDIMTRAQAGSSIFAFLHYRAMVRRPGIYMVEAALGSSSMSNPILVCSEPLCKEQAPLARDFDAFVYDRNGTRALIEVGALTANVIPNTPNIANTDLQNSAYQVTVSYLGSNGRKLGAALGWGCSVDTGICPSNFYTDVFTSSFLTARLSSTTPVALFRVITPSSGTVTINACNSAAIPLAPIGVSAFLGGFPTAHAFYSGSVGVSGDAVDPGVLPSAPFATCANTTLAVATGRVVWVAVGSPGNFRGSVITASVTINLRGSIPVSNGACPRGSYKSGIICVLCPIPGQSSTGLAISAQDCFCPTDFLPTVSGCEGQELGGPNAVSASVAAFPPCPAGKSLSAGACVDCPVGAVAAPSSSYGFACAFKHFKVVEVAAETKSFMAGIFARNTLGAGKTEHTYTMVGSSKNYTWAINPSTNSWQLCNSSDIRFCYDTPGWALAGASALHLISLDSLAFCDNVGDSTVDFLGRRVCYCGAGMQKDASSNICQACPSGQTRTVGGAASKVEVCSYPVSTSTSSTLAGVFAENRSLIIGASIGGALLLVTFCVCLYRRCLSTASEEAPEAPAPSPRKRAPSAAQTTSQTSSQDAELPPRTMPKAARRPSEAQARSPSPPLRPSSARRTPPEASSSGGGGDIDSSEECNAALEGFLAACARGDAVSVAATLRAAPPPLVQQLLTAQSEPSGRSPLHLAVRAGSLPLVQLLLEWGAPPNARDGARRTPLCAAARARDSGSAAVLVGALLSGGASAARSDARGRTALHHAALACNLDAVAQLLAWGAAPQAEDAEGATPLELAERADGASPRAMFRLRELLLARPGPSRGGGGSSSRPLVLLEPGRLPRSSSAAAPQAPAHASAPQPPSRSAKRSPSVGAYV